MEVDIFYGADDVHYESKIERHVKEKIKNAHGKAYNEYLLVFRRDELKNRLFPREHYRNDNYENDELDCFHEKHN